MDGTSNNIELLNHLLDLLEGENPPKWILVTYKRKAQQDYINQLSGALTDYTSFLADLRGEEINSLSEVLGRRFTEEAKATEHDLIHILGIESGLIMDAINEEGQFVSQWQEMNKHLASFASGVIFWIYEDVAQHIRSLIPTWENNIDNEFKLTDEGGEKPELTDPISDGEPAIKEDLDRVRNYMQEEQMFSALQLIQQIQTHETASASQLAEANFQLLRVAQHAELQTEDLAQSVLDLAGEEAPYWKARALRAQSFDAFQAGDMDTFEDLIEEAIELMEEKALWGLSAHTRRQQALVYRRLGDNRKAAIILQRALKDLTQMDVPLPAGPYYRALAMALENLGETATARERYKQAGIAFGEDEAFDQAAACFFQRGSLFQNERKWAEAKESFESALPYAQQSGDEIRVAAMEDSIEEMEKLANKHKKKGWFR